MNWRVNKQLNLKLWGIVLFKNLETITKRENSDILRFRKVESYWGEKKKKKYWYKLEIIIRIKKKLKKKNTSWKSQRISVLPRMRSFPVRAARWQRARPVQFSRAPAAGASRHPTSEACVSSYEYECGYGLLTIVRRSIRVWW